MARRNPVLTTAVVATSLLLTAASIVTSYLVSTKNAELAGARRSIGRCELYYDAIAA